MFMLRKLVFVLVAGLMASISFALPAHADSTLASRSDTYGPVYAGSYNIDVQQYYAVPVTLTSVQLSSGIYTKASQSGNSIAVTTDNFTENARITYTVSDGSSQVTSTLTVSARAVLEPQATTVKTYNRKTKKAKVSFKNVDPAVTVRIVTTFNDKNGRTKQVSVSPGATRKLKVKAISISYSAYTISGTLIQYGVLSTMPHA